MLHKSFPAHFKAAPDGSGEIEAIVSVFNNVDRAGERVLPGYFAKSLARKLPKGVWMHDWTRPIAVTDEARELAPGDPLLPESLKALGGLYVKGRINLDVQDGKDALSHLRFGSVDEFSFGYSNTKTAYDSETEVRDLVEGEIYEWSPVLVGCNPATALLSAKDMGRADPDDLLEGLEATLLALGGKTLDAGQLAVLARHAGRLSDLAGTKAKAAYPDPFPLIDLERRSLDQRRARALA